MSERLIGARPRPRSTLAVQWSFSPSSLNELCGVPVSVTLETAPVCCPVRFEGLFI